MFADEFKIRYTTIPYAFCRENQHGSPFTLFAHQHKEVELIAMLEGEADFYVDSVLYKLKGGDLLVVPPYCIHRGHVNLDTLYECVCFDLSLIWDAQLREDLENGVLTVNRALYSEDQDTSEMSRCVHNSVRAFEENAPGWEMEVIGNLSLLFAGLKRLGFFVASNVAAHNLLFEKKVSDYIYEHFFEPITSRTAAEALFLNNSYFCRLFKKNYGCCFAEYLMEYRIERAKYLLNNTKDSVSDIALKTGFNSFSFFSKSFKSLMGISPSEYRRGIAPKKRNAPNRYRASIALS